MLPCTKDPNSVFFQLFEVALRSCGLNSRSHSQLSDFNHHHSFLLASRFCIFRRLNDAPMIYPHLLFATPCSPLHLLIGVC
jgi:hypothetical protein